MCALVRTSSHDRMFLHGGEDVRLSKESYLENLDPEQLEAVLKSSGRSLIIAGPGSGKTRVITYKLAYLLQCGVKPSNILLVTFTRAAANEMIDRARRVTGQDLEDMTAGTFHHICNTFLRRYASKMGLMNNYTILDQEDSKSLIRHARAKIVGRSDEKKRFPSPSVLRSIFSFSANTLVSIREAVLKRNPSHYNFITQIEEIYKEYTLEKRNQNCVDYDDLLVFAVSLFEQDDRVRQREASRFKWILVDEFQDTNILQLKLVEYLASVHENITVVADDSQSIYSFRGARYENVRDFMSVPNTSVFRIQTNYRSTDSIVNFINAVIPSGSIPKKLRSVKKNGVKPRVVKTWDRYEEAGFVVEEIQKLLNEGFDPREIAILYRSHSHSLEIQVELAKNQMDFRVLSGLKFTETAHIKDIMAFLKIIHNVRDKISWIRVARLFPGIGAKTASRLADHAFEKAKEGASILEIFDSFLSKKSTSLKQLRELLQGTSEIPEVAGKIDFILKEFYAEHLRDTYADSKDRQMDVETLIEMASRYSSLERFLTDLTISEDFNNTDHESKLTLTTVHQAKGLEWDVVFILSVNPGDFPSAYALMDGKMDEEERIFYVAVTRARKRLYIINQTLRNYDLSLPTRAADFVERIPSDLAIFDSVL